MAAHPILPAFIRSSGAVENASARVEPWLSRRGDVTSPSRAEAILIASARPNRSQHLISTLQELDYCFIHATRPSEVTEVLATQRVDLVIADCFMPDRGAMKVCSEVRNCPTLAALPVLLWGRTGHVEEEVLALDAGADGFLPNTSHPSAIRALVQASLRRKAAIEALDDSETVLFTLAQSVEERDPALSQHCGRLALMAASMGMALGLSSKEILSLQRGGYLHDVGKIAIPDAVLFKAGPLTPEEWVIMKSHPERGERICRNVRSLEPVLPIIRHHHERWDGGGYPDGLKGEDIPLAARIIQFADIYDALTTARPYKAAFQPDEAVRIMQQETEKGWRDPELMKVFLDLLPIFEQPATLDMTELSLQALAISLDGYSLKSPLSDAPLLQQPTRMVSGL